MSNVTGQENLKEGVCSLPAVMTVEAAIVMAVVLLALAMAIMTAYRMRDTLVSDFVLQEAAVDGAYTEDVFLQEDGIYKAEQNANLQLQAVPSVGGSAEVKRDMFRAEATADGGRESHGSCRINDVENFMRFSAVVLDWKEKVVDGKEN